MPTSSDITEEVKKLYNKVPYAAYDADYFPVVKSLGMSREEFAVFARGKRAVEIGCGGGQLSLFLASHFDSVMAVDISVGSLESAKAAAVKKNITNIEFVEGNLFDNAFLEKYLNSCDFVLCYGVLHHTGNASLGYAGLSRLLAPSGILVTGVYSRTQLSYRVKRQLVLWLAGKDWSRREVIARKLFFKPIGNDVSIYDGYVHPHVSFHSIYEVEGWAKSNKLSYIGSWPHFELGWYVDTVLSLFSFPKKMNTTYHFRFLFLIVEFIWLIRGKLVMVSMAAKK